MDGVTGDGHLYGHLYGLHLYGTFPAPSQYRSAWQRPLSHQFSTGCWLELGLSVLPRDTTRMEQDLNHQPFWSFDIPLYLLSHSHPQPQLCYHFYSKLVQTAGRQTCRPTDRMQVFGTSFITRRPSFWNWKLHPSFHPVNPEISAAQPLSPVWRLQSRKERFVSTALSS